MMLSPFDTITLKPHFMCDLWPRLMAASRSLRASLIGMRGTWPFLGTTGASAGAAGMVCEWGCGWGCVGSPGGGGGGLREEDGLGKGCRKQGGQGSEEKGCMSGKEMAWHWPGQRRGQWDCQRQSGQREWEEEVEEEQEVRNTLDAETADHWDTNREKKLIKHIKCTQEMSYKPRAHCKMETHWPFMF